MLGLALGSGVMAMVRVKEWCSEDNSIQCHSRVQMLPGKTKSLCRPSYPQLKGKGGFPGSQAIGSFPARVQQVSPTPCPNIDYQQSQGPSPLNTIWVF